MIFLVNSEIWPNLILANQLKIPMILINADLLTKHLKMDDVPKSAKNIWFIKLMFSFKHRNKKLS